MLFLRCFFNLRDSTKDEPSPWWMQTDACHDTAWQSTDTHPFSIGGIRHGDDTGSVQREAGVFYVGLKPRAQDCGVTEVAVSLPLFCRVSVAVNFEPNPEPDGTSSRLRDPARSFISSTPFTICSREFQNVRKCGHSAETSACTTMRASINPV